MSDAGRDLPAELAAEIDEPALRPFLAVAIDTPDPVRAFTGKGSIPFAGDDWTGIEGIASIEQVGEKTDGSATGVRCTLFKVPMELAGDLADQAVRGVGYRLYVGALDTAFNTVLAHKLIWAGTLQQYDIVDDGTSLTVTAGGESRAIDQRRGAIKRFTDDYQQGKFPGDKFFEYVPKLVEVQILWAKANQTSAL